MSTLAVTNTHISGTVITAAAHNQNNSDIVAWANGNIAQDNFDTMSGTVEWVVTTNVESIDITQSGTSSSILVTHTGTGSAPLIELLSTTKGNRIAPVMSASQRDALTASTGLTAYNSTDKRLDVYNGAWHGVGSVRKLVSKVATYTATYADDVIECDATGGAITINLPAAATLAGKILEIKKTDTSANAVTADGNASETVAGATTFSLAAAGDFIVIQSDGTNWKLRYIHKAPTQQRFTSGSGTYTTPTAVLYIDVIVVGAGGGGGGSGSAGLGTGGTGGASTFGSSLLTATGGIGGSGGTPPAGGTATVNSPAFGSRFSGGSGQGGLSVAGAESLSIPGGSGGNSVLGGGGGCGVSASGAGATNTGGGGSGGPWNANSNGAGDAGSGGGAGAYITAKIFSPSATYSYAVGAAGTAGTNGTNGTAGGPGGSGYVEVTEYY